MLFVVDTVLIRILVSIPIDVLKYVLMYFRMQLLVPRDEFSRSWVRDLYHNLFIFATAVAPCSSSVDKGLVFH